MERNELSDSKVRVRLLSRREIDAETDCWLYMGATTGNGYGYARYGNDMAYVHRLSAIFYLDFAPEPGLYVLHRCDNPQCFNPAHLFVGTAKDNIRDAVAKGRMRGKKLTYDQVAEIKSLLDSGRTQRQIADKFGVTAANIGQIARGETWAHVQARPAPDRGGSR